MNSYINTSTLAFPVSEAQIRAQYATTSFPAGEFVPPPQFAAVRILDFPEGQYLKKVTLQETPALVSGEWVLDWDIADYSPSELATVTAGFADTQVQRIKKMRDVKLQSNGFLVGTKWFHSDTFSRTQQVALFNLGANIPVGLQWKTMDGTFVTMTQQLAADIFAAGVASDTALFAFAEGLITDVNAAVDPLVVDITTGWPAGYTA
jgi:hypothetical protein